MENINFAELFRRSVPPLSLDATRVKRDYRSGDDGDDTLSRTVMAASTSASSYTSCSHGSLPPHTAAQSRNTNCSNKKSSNRAKAGNQDGEYSRRGNREEASGSDDEVALRLLHKPRGANNKDRNRNSGEFNSLLPSDNDRIELKAHMDLSDDSTSLRTYWDALFYPEVYMKIFYALRITLFVALPLGILARHPSGGNIFPAHVVLPLWGIVDCKYTVGEQFAASIVSIQCGVWMMLWGSVNNAWNLREHRSAWWCSVIFGAFAVSLLGNVRGKRFFVLQTVMILQMQGVSGGTAVVYPVKFGRDLMMATCFSIVQAFFPPKSISGEVDEMLAAGWKDISRLLRNAVKAVWTDDPIESAMAMGNLSTDPLQSIFAGVPPKMFFIVYEPWESTLRLELRKERLDLLRLCAPRLHTISAAARSLVMRRVSNVFAGLPNADKGNVQEKHKHHRHHNSYHHCQEEKDKDGTERGVDDTGGLHSPLSKEQHEPFSDENKNNDDGVQQSRTDQEASDGSDVPKYFTTVRRSASKLLSLDGSKHPTHAAGPHGRRQPYRSGGGDDYDHRRGDDSDLDDYVTYGDHHGGGGAPEAADKELHELHQKRLEVEYRMEQRLRRLGKEILLAPLEHFLECLDNVLDGLGKHLNPRDTVEHVPFDALQDASAELEVALNKVHFKVLVKSDAPVDPLVYSTTIFFHGCMIALAERLIEYGESMKDFDRSRYKSQYQRIWEFFFYDWWKGFWRALPNRMMLATPHDRRIFKDAIKMACAYGVGVMFTEYTDTEHVYSFGMAILMGVGWPTAGDTMVASVYRVTGMAAACSIAYMAVWHSQNLPQELAIALSGVFMSLLFRDVPPYSHTAQYCSMLICTALSSASTKLVLLARIVSNTFTVMAYYLICVFLFPTNVLKQTASTQARSIIVITERFSVLTDILTAPLYPDDPNQADAINTSLNIVFQQRMHMWNLVAAFGEWLPKALAEPNAHGQPYPFNEQKRVHASLRRLAAVTDIMCTGLQQLHRQGSDDDASRASVTAIVEAVVPVMVQIDRRGRIVMQDFIDASARPYDWSPESATRHLSEFLLLSDDLHRAFFLAHRRITRARRQQFSDGVMNRTFAAAANANLIESSFAAAAAQVVGNLSFFHPASAAVTHGAKHAGSLNSSSNLNFSNNISTFSPTNRQSPSPLATAAASRPGNASFVHLKNIAQVEREEAERGEHHPAPVTNSSITKTILDTLKFMDEHSTQASPRGFTSSLNGCTNTTDRRGLISQYLPQPRVNVGVDSSHSNDNPLQVSGDEKGGGKCWSRPPSSMASPSRGAAAAAGDGDGGGGGAGAAAAAAVAETLPPNQSFAHVLMNASMTVKDLQEALIPMERRAEDEEYKLLITKRRNPQFRLQANEFTMSHDINAVISLLVGADIFFSEAEQLVKTMYYINSYVKSHKPVPGSSMWDTKVTKSDERQ